MIPTSNEACFNAGLEELRSFGRLNGARGRFIALFLGLRLMGDKMAPLGSSESTATREIEDFMDLMWTKTHIESERNVLTSPFQSGGSSGGYSSRTGFVAVGNSEATNTWRNNLNLQKGVGCVASPHLISNLITHEDARAACPHFSTDTLGHACALADARYRGEKQAIWLARRPSGGFQVVNLDEENVYEPYLRPNAKRIPLFALMAVLYSFTPPSVYPSRLDVTVADFESDFNFADGAVRISFDCDPDSAANARILRAKDWPSGRHGTADGLELSRGLTTREIPALVHPLPDFPEAVMLNSGVYAEVLVGRVLQSAGWLVSYTAGQSGLGYDLRAESLQEVIYIEVKSSVGFTRPILTESEWHAAEKLGDSFVLAVVDFVDNPRETVHFIRNPALHLNVQEKQTSTFSLAREGWERISSAEPPAADV